MKQIIKNITLFFLDIPLIIGVILFWVLYFFLNKKKNPIQKPRLLFGLDPIISNKYWSQALQEKGFDSTTIMWDYYSSINNQSDFDLYVHDLFPLKYLSKKFSKLISSRIGGYFVFIYSLLKFDIFHFNFQGGPLNRTPLKFIEAFLLQSVGKKIIVLGYGGDFYQYSKVLNPFWKHGLIVNYPNFAKNEHKIQKRVNYWIKNADIIINGFQIDGLSRYDLLPFSHVVLNTKEWKMQSKQKAKKGEAIKIVHTPNHRGIKGTEFLISAVNDLKKEGYSIDLILLEKVQNSVVRKIMQEEADILVSQLNSDAYGLSSIEGMACGVPVICNLEEGYYTPLFRRFSYLNECPILSATPENIKEILRKLIEDAELRRVLGKAGREYVEKYHSYQTCKYMFSKVYEKIWFNQEIDLINMYHPLMPNSYNNLYPKVNHPLVKNKIKTTNLKLEKIS